MKYNSLATNDVGGNNRVEKVLVLSIILLCKEPLFKNVKSAQ